MGASGVLIIGVVRGRLNLKTIYRCLVDSIQVTASIFFILIGALLFGYFLTVTQAPQKVATLLLSFDLGAYGTLLLILLLFLILGCILDAMAMIVLMIPIIYPVILQLGFDPIWFGVIIVMTVELGLITPPVGMNVFVLNSVLPDVPLQTIFRGLVPFIVADILKLALLIAVPAIILVLPSMM